MNLLIVHTSHDGSITVIKDDKLVVHSQLERFNKIKSSPYPTIPLIQKIKRMNIEFDNVIFTCLWCSNWWLWEEMLRAFDIINNKTHFEVIHSLDHHVFHMYCAKATTGDNDYFAIIDGGGDHKQWEGNDYYEQESLYKNDHVVTKMLYTKSDIHPFTENMNWKIKNHNGIGNVYESITGCLFPIARRPFILTGKTMALSTFGNFNPTYFSAIRQGYLKNKFYQNLAAVKLTENKEDKFTQDFLTTFQKFVEKEVGDFLPQRNVTFTGGVAQNILLNTQLRKRAGFKVDPMCNDQGISLGVANRYLKGGLKVDSVYLGFEPEYDMNIFKGRKVSDCTYDDVAKLVHTEPVGIFNGRSEQGQRGLGARSLVINPLAKDAREKINKIKKREWYRPFAPVVMEEYASDYFDIEGNSPYMLYVFKCKKDIQAIMANDGMSRIQTVNEKQNKHFYNLLKAYKTKYDLPLLLNTSLNMSGLTLAEDLYDIKYMLDYSDLNYCYFPEINKLVS